MRFHSNIASLSEAELAALLVEDPAAAEARSRLAKQLAMLRAAQDDISATLA